MDNNPNYYNNNSGNGNYGTQYNNQYSVPNGQGYYYPPIYSHTPQENSTGGYSYYQNLYNMFGGYNPIVDKEAVQLSRYGLITGTLILCVFAMQFIVGLVISNGSIADLYSDNVDFSMAFSALAQIFYMFVPFFVYYLFSKSEDKKQMNVFNAPKSGMLYILGVFAGLGLCLAGNSATTLFAISLEVFGVTFFSGSEDMAIPTSVVGVLIYIFSTAVMPALFEEFAFRGVVMQPLRKYGDWFAILMSAFCFAIVHANMVQIPFAFIAGVSLGYFCIKTKSIWTSVTIHFLNNLISVLFSVYFEKYPNASVLIYYIATSALVLIGVVAMIVFRKNCMVKTKKDATAMNKHKRLKKAAFVTCPTLIIAINFVIITTLGLTQTKSAFGLFVLFAGLFFVMFTLFRWINVIRTEKMIKYRKMYTASRVLLIIASIVFPIASLFTLVG